ncbi:hypothetical protein Tco_0895043 [Tanacetum coccineum]|uniref:Uncharacterized protein n=1 Tax=Tanacetum coccineum TaxID=301880 RepID=A0ABQ5CDI0_9ASTR
MDNWPPGLSNPSPPPCVSRPPPGFPNSPPGFEPLLSTQSLFVNINNNTPLLYNNAPPLENLHHPPPNLGNQDFPNPSNNLDFVHPNDMPHLHNMFCQCCSTTKHEIQMLRNRVNYMHKARQQDKVYEEREESCWIPHLRTGIFYPKGLEGVTNEVPDGVAIFASNYWLRNNNMYRV